MILEKIDLRKQDKTYYKATLQPEIVDLESYYYLSISGQSAPEAQIFHDSIGLIYSVAYGIKFLCKAEDNDFVVPKMEGYWWIPGGAEKQAEFENAPRDSWMWKIAIRMPDFVEETHFFHTMRVLRKKKPGMDFEDVKFELINEGRSAQILHKGSYENEKESLSKLHGFISESGLKINGYHHEIYITDPRKTAEDKLQTIIRYAAIMQLSI